MIGALFMTFLPFGNMEDISRDGKVDLQDVILVVKGVARTVETNQSLRVRVGKALAVINVAAGLKKVFKKNNDIQNALSLYDNLFLLSTCSYGLPKGNPYSMMTNKMDYHSINSLPEIPPPKKVFYMITMECDRTTSLNENLL